MATPVTPAVLQAGFQGFSALFQQGRKTKTPWWTAVASAANSESEEEIYYWMQGLLKMRPFTGARKRQRVGVNGYRLKNEKFEQTIAVDRAKFADDKLGQFKEMFMLMGQQFEKFPDHKLYPLLKNGATNLCWDGKAFFADDHPCDPNNESVGTFDNKFALALTQDNFDTVYAAIQSIKGEDNEPLGIEPDTLIVPPKLRKPALMITEAEWVPSTAGTASQSNVNKGIVRTLVIPELAGDDTTWYLAQCNGVLKPLIYQNREERQLEQRISPTDENVWDRDEYEYGSYRRAGFGYGLPQLIAQSVG